MVGAFEGKSSALSGACEKYLLHAPPKLNQYTSLARSNPLRRLIEGLAHSQAMIEVALLDPLSPLPAAPVAVARVAPGGEGFVSAAAVTLGSEPLWRKVTITASRPGVGVGGGPVHTVRHGWLCFPPETESPAYDEVY